MAVLSPEQIQELAEENERRARLRELKTFFNQYFPKALNVKPWLKRASVEEGPYARLEDVTVFDEVGHQLTTTRADYREALRKVSSAVAFYDDEEVYLGDVDDEPITVTVDNEVFQRLFPGDDPQHETPFGLFKSDDTDIAATIACRFGSEAKADILEDLEHSDHLLLVDMATAYAVLQTRGLERALTEIQSQGTKPSTLFFGLDSVLQLNIHLCKLAIINAVRST